MRIPRDTEGYSVSTDGLIHTRYTSHAKGTRVRTANGVLSVLGEQKGKVCTACYPAPMRDEKPKTPQRRRVESA